MSRSESKLSVERAVLGTTAAIVVFQVWVQAAAAAFGAMGLGYEAGSSVSAVVLGSLSVAASAASWRRASTARFALGAGLLSAILLTALFPGAWAWSVALFSCVTLSSVAGCWFAQKLPNAVDGSVQRHRRWAFAWAALALVTVVQMGRLSSYMGDPEVDWFLTTKNPFWAKHECLPAYFQAAGLAGDGEPNVYHADHYPGLNPKAEPVPALDGMTVEDPFQYAPQFLLWPHLAMQITHDYTALKLGWFALNTTFLMFVALLLARWIGERSGGLSALASPLALIAFPALHTLQYGQFHLSAIALALLAMMAFEHRRFRLCGALMAVSVLSKIFPGILLVVLAVQRRFRELAYTALVGAGMTVATLAVFGADPFLAFFDYHLARLADGAAFAFGDAWPEIATLVVADNQGFYGLVTKLNELGVPGTGQATAVFFNRVMALGLLALAGFVGLRQRAASNEQRAIVWLGLLGLASMVSTGAFGDYVPITATWLLSLMLPRLLADRRLLWLLLPTWVLQFTLLGTTPLGDWFEPVPMLLVSALSLLSMAALCIWSALGAPVLSSPVVLPKRAARALQVSESS